jgi:hypothetical protein
MVKEDNPAGRLYKILLDLKSKQPPLSMRVVWADVFGIEPGNIINIYSHLIRLQELVNEVDKSIRLQDVDHEIFLQHLPKVRAILTLTNLDTPLSNVSTNLSESVLLALQFCSDKLSKACPERTPSEKEIKELLVEISQLAEHILNSHINKNLKEILSELVESMRQAVAEYRIRGGVGLRQELFYILERLQRTIPLLEKDKDNLLVKKFWEVLSRYDAFTSILVNAPVMLQQFQQVMHLMP